MDLASGRAVGIEALARWQSGDTLVSPADFIPIAEQSGMIVPLAEQIYQQAFHDLKDLNDRGHPLTLSINLSPAQLRVESFPEIMQQMLAANDLTSSSIELEITETVMMENISMVRKTIDRLVQVGFSLAIDDFGTGYSSIGYLKLFPLSTLKIDRSFVMGIGHNKDDEQLIETIVLMARQFQLTIVAEGIEQQSQELFLRGLACDQGQGYLYGRPMAFDSLQDWLRTYHEHS